MTACRSGATDATGGYTDREDMDVFSEFHHIAGHPADYARKWRRDTGGKVIGSYCSYMPEEIVLAGGALPFRIFGSSAERSSVDAYLHTCSCDRVRSALADAIDGDLAYLDGVVFPHTCDAVQRLSDIWRFNNGGRFHANVALPAKLNTKSAADYMTAVFRTFKDVLQGELGREITDSDLAAAIDTYNRIRTCWEQLYRLRRDNPDAIDGRDFYAVAKASMVMDRHVLPEKLMRVIRWAEDRAGAPRSGKKRVVLSGGICGAPDVYQLVGAAGATVVWDDLCVGWRYFNGLTAIAGDPLAAIATRYRRWAVCPAKHVGLKSRADQLIDLVKQSRGEVVIFLILKFCDPHQFDHPYLKTALDAADIPSLAFEIQEPLPVQGQVVAQCKAFVDTL